MHKHLAGRLARVPLARLSALLAIVGAGLSTAPAKAQLGDSIPATAYYATFGMFYEGEYRDALLMFQNELRGGIKTPTSRWVDSICYHTLCGECYYHMGQYPAALEQYTAALKLYGAYSDWMLRVNFPPTIAQAGIGSRPVLPWGTTRRATRIGNFPDSFLISQGQINNNAVVAQGGVVQAAIMVPVRVSEIVRATSLAMRRRRELMGPVCKYDPLTNELVARLVRRPAPPNNWSQTWVDVLLGAAYASAGDSHKAATVLERALVVGGEFDHPLTATALLEMGQLYLQSGDFVAASRLFEEATYAAATFTDLGLLEEAFRLGTITHLLSNQKGLYPPLERAGAWAKSQGFRQLQASLAILAAENYASLGQTKAAAGMIIEANNAVGHRAMAAGTIGARLNLAAALTAYQTGQVPAGDQALASAMSFQHTGSLWLFHIGLADSLYLSGDVSDRVGLLLYDFVLRDPTPADWATSPLESLSVLTSPHPLPYDHWFEAVLKRNKEPELALEIADRSRRHRFFSTLPAGGRLLALRWILEGPKELLNEQAQLERQDLLARFPRYEQLALESRKIRTELAQKPVVDEDVDARKEQAKQFAALAAISQNQEVILREMAVRREAAEMVFPPLRKTKDVQQALAPGQLLLAFYATSNDNLYAFLFGHEKYAMWRIGAPSQLRRHLGTLLKELGNFEHNHVLTSQEMGKDAWKKSAARIMELLFDKSNVDLSVKFDELVIVPDGLLWYLPFEVLPIGKKDQVKPLLMQARVRYAPTVGLAVPYNIPSKPGPGATGVVVGKLYPHDDETVAQGAFEQLSKSVEGSVALPHVLPASSSVFRMLLDGLIVLDDIKPGDGSPYGWSPAQIDGSKPGGSLAAWFSLPWGGPERVILPGFHTAAENGLRKNTVGGSDLFLATCGLMSSGARTVLISRWRPGGQTSFELVREFAQELPHTSAADAWQRAVQVASSAPLDPEQEPRLKKAGANATPVNADHPFFWAGYMLVDSGRLGADQAAPPAPLLEMKKEPPRGDADVKLQPDPLLPGVGKGVPEVAPLGPPLGGPPVKGNGKGKPKATKTKPASGRAARQPAIPPAP